MQLTIVGTGYVGLVTGACLADLGHNVICIDNDNDKVDRLSRGEVPIFEPGLIEVVERTTKGGKLTFTSDYTSAVPPADAVFVAVGTPSSADGEADLSHVDEVVKAIGPLLKSGTTVAIKSTVPVGTARRIARRLAAYVPDLKFSMVSNPEFLRQGDAIADFMHPDRIVVGSSDQIGADTMRRVYQPLLRSGITGLFVDLETAELTKYASNAFLATKLSFINEIADLCEAAGASIEGVARGIGLDARISDRFLVAGPGYGGSCLPKDTQALVHTSLEHGTPSRIVTAAVEVNADRKHRMVAKITDALNRPVEDAQLAVLGLTYKANTDDVRESPALDIIRELRGRGAIVRVYDPEGMDQARALIPSVLFMKDPYDTMTNADALVILTEWSEFATLDLDRVRSLLADALIVDLRNLYEPGHVADHGLAYVSVGRAPCLPDTLPTGTNTSDLGV